jgi:hypothetical protein
MGNYWLVEALGIIAIQLFSLARLINYYYNPVKPGDSRLYNSSSKPAAFCKSSIKKFELCIAGTTKNFGTTEGYSVKPNYKNKWVSF